MEQTHQTIEGQSSWAEAAEHADEVLNQWVETTLAQLETHGDIEATQYLVSSTAEQSPAAQEALCDRQTAISNELLAEFRKSADVVPEVSQHIIAYFNLDQAAMDDLHENLSPVWLDIWQLLENFKNYIENNLSGLPEEQKQKIKTSIGRRTGNISEIVAEMKSECAPEDDFKTFRWILNEKIWEAYNFYTEKLFPTIGVYMKLWEWESIPEKYHSRKEYFATPMWGTWVETNPNNVNVTHYMEELEELLDASVNAEWDFDEGFFSTQQLINTQSDTHTDLVQDMWVTSMDNISLLNEDDKEIEAKAMMYYLCAVGIQCLPYIGGITGAAADGVDIFSDHDATMSFLQKTELVDKQYRMEKTTLDRVLAWLGIVLTVVGLQALAKSKKVAKALKSMGKVSKATVDSVVENFSQSMNLSDDMKDILKNFLLGKDKDISDAEKLWDIRNGWKTSEVNRSSLEEDLPRENLRLREIRDFQDLTPEQAQRVNELLQDVIGNMKYNSFEKIDKLFDHFFANQRPGYTLQDAFKEFDLSKVDCWEWSNCVGMSLELQSRLAEEWIDARLIRFDAGGLINNDYVVNGHSALVIPYMKDGEESFMLSDPWLMIRLSLAFKAWENSDEVEIGGKVYKILAQWNEDLPYTLQIWDKRLLFDPHNEWINPAETLNRDIMRAIWDYKIVKQNPPGRPTVFRFDLENESIRFSTDQWKLDISLTDFAKLDTNSDQYKVYQAIMTELWENPEEFYSKTVRIIQHIWEYKQQVWAPSTREIINKQ